VDAPGERSDPAVDQLGPDSQRIWWSDTGVHQNLTFPVHPDPVSGMHCWHQVVKVEKAGGTTLWRRLRHTALAHQVYLKWKSLCALLRAQATCAGRCGSRGLPARARGVPDESRRLTSR